MPFVPPSLRDEDEPKRVASGLERAVVHFEEKKASVFQPVITQVLPSTNLRAAQRFIFFPLVCIINMNMLSLLDDEAGPHDGGAAPRRRPSSAA